MLRALVIASPLLLCAVIVAGCSDDARETSRGSREERAAPRRTADPGPGYEVIEVVNGGTITGEVTWSGERPEPVDVDVSIHAERCGETQRSPALSISRRGGVGDTVVWIEGIQRGRAGVPPEEPVSITIDGCVFRPHVVAAPVGAQIEIRNAEGILHNVHAQRVEHNGGAQTWFSEGLPEQGAAHRFALDRAGILRLVDDAGHPWMLAWIHALEHPYHAVTDAEGRFQLTGIPPGQYVVRAWHEGFLVTGETESGRPVYSAPIVLSRPVTVSSGHDTPIDFTIGVASAEAAGL